LNPGLKEYGLKSGQQLNLTETTAINNVQQITGKINASTVIVEKGETIYGIAVKNNTTASALYELNPGLQQNGLKVGQPINIPVGSKQTETTSAKPETKPKTITIQPKETLYSISKAYGVSQEQLLQWNPDLKDGLKVGTVVIVGYNETHEKSVMLQINENSTTNFTKKGIDLTLPNDGATRNLVLLLPFNVAQNNFNNPSINQNIKENVFLNMTLDFYSGA